MRTSFPRRRSGGRRRRIPDLIGGVSLKTKTKRKGVVAMPAPELIERKKSFHRQCSTIFSPPYGLFHCRRLVEEDGAGVGGVRLEMPSCSCFPCLLRM